MSKSADPNSRFAAVGRSYRRRPFLMGFLTVLLMVAVALCISLPATLAHKHHKRSAYQSLATGNVNCACGYYVPETSLTLTSMQTFEPSAYNGSTQSDMLAFLQSQGWSVDNRQLSTKPAKVNYTAANVALTSSELDLIVSGGPASAASINSAQARTNNSNFQFGSFRFTAEASTVPGACHGMFFYRNDYAEIDLEILTRYISGQAEGPHDPGLKMTIQPLQRGRYGSKNIAQFNGIDPTGSFNEYRFDWSPDQVTWYANGEKKAQVVDANLIPSGNGSIILNNWSNGNTDFTGDPPSVDSIFKVRKVLLFYNSTDSATNAAQRTACSNSKDQRLCLVDL